MAKTEELYPRFIDKLRELRHLSHVISLLGWDQQVYLPKGAAEGRGQQLALLTTLRHEHQTAPEFVDLLQKLHEKKDLPPDAAVNVRETWKEIERALLVPPELVSAIARQESDTHTSWIEARQENRFAVVKDQLQELFKLKREYAAAISKGRPLYDTLLDLYEPEMTESEVREIFSKLGPALSGLLSRITAKTGGAERKNPARDIFPEEKQAAFFLEVLQAMGFDLNCGRLDKTVHPFCNDVGFVDIRLTVRYNEKDIAPGLFGLVHEAGHGLYEQGFLPENGLTPLAEAISLGIHESQSLLWEKRVGRSREFWKYLYPKMQTSFPAALGGVGLEEFYRYVNQARPSLIRIDADEVSYGLHVIIRFELESELVSGSLDVADLPQAWDERYVKYLGIKSPDEIHGVLQDTHWYSGLIGYFPTYLLGAAYASQIFEKFTATNTDGLAAIARGDLLPLKIWLNENVHQHGKRYSARELIKRVTGKEPGAESMVAYLNRKYSDLYDLN